ncbi:MAG: DUF1501 domain-containing protein [Verrucomicrobiae bacterium]|nr:DUF1501 domain-containing protein [Verrucomicrobiae bacterium]
MAGGGVRGGRVYGATDEIGYKAVENRTYLSDLQATLLHQLGLDHQKLEVVIAGRPVRLVEEGSKPIRGLLA